MTHGLVLSSGGIYLALCELNSIQLCYKRLLRAGGGREYDPLIEMSKATGVREAQHPQSRQDRDAILLEMQRVLASPHFCNSKRYPALLQYIVENTLAGKFELLKERTLGVEVFDRPPSYDTNADTVVRYTAGEVRKRLSLYYHELGHKPRIRISLPAGSYVPEFLHEHEEVERSEEIHYPLVPRDSSTGLFAEIAGEAHEPGHASPLALADRAELSPAKVGGHSAVPAAQSGMSRRRIWLASAATLAILVLAGAGWKYHSIPRKSALDDFWSPVLRDQRIVPICTGGSVFAQDRFSGVATAGRDIDYPFVSIQVASAIAQVSALLERNGTTTELQLSASTPLTGLLEHPVILLGGYNNQWTLRLLQPLRFHFSPELPESIVDQTNPGVHWERDQSLPYSSADDYALVARYRDPTTDGWVVVLAGVGRNGSEAAADFVTSPHYMQLLRDRAGAEFSNRNIEAILKVSVIEGKTGAPSILATHVW